jgi:hypothetical protein
MLGLRSQENLRPWLSSGCCERVSDWAIKGQRDDTLNLRPDPQGHYESFNDQGTQEVNGKAEASWTRHGVRHGQDIHARPQGAVVTIGCASDTRV